MIGVTLFALLAPAQDAFLLSPMFGSHMVLQRDRTNTFWGWAEPGTPVKVSVGGKEGRGFADKDGKWAVRISPPPAGGPYSVIVEGPRRIALTDVLVGDVWVCSGQSNMEWGIAQSNNPKTEIANADFPSIRLFTVPHAVSPTPLKLTAGSWSVCTPQNVAPAGTVGFSAVAYFFGRSLHQTLKVPIGLVHTSWGGTIAEAWTSEQGLRPLKDFDSALDLIVTQGGSPELPIDKQWDDWYARYDEGTKSNWQVNSARIDRALLGWPSFEDMGLGAYDGVVWLRRDFELASPPGSGATLSLGPIDDMDTTWVNGVKVGGIGVWNVPRRYTIPAGVLRQGANTIVVRVLDTGGQGGCANAESMKLEVGPNTLDLRRGWHYALGTSMASAGPVPAALDGNPNVPTVLHNGMIAPIVPLAIKGAIWYQGESNAGRALQYRRLLPALIGDWRKAWGQGDFPFFIVQLANFTQRHPEPRDEAWAELREAQAMTARKVKNAGLAVAIDIGEANDIHPRNKQDVGHRLALAALRVAYGKSIAYSGPEYRSMKREGSAIRLSFNHADGLRSNGKLAGFAIAGADRKFFWADAEIQGNTVLVRSTSVTEPVAVRYAWDANPEATLYNAAGLPAIPFRTDSWPGITK